MLRMYLIKVYEEMEKVLNRNMRFKSILEVYSLKIVKPKTTNILKYLLLPSNIALCVKFSKLRL